MHTCTHTVSCLSTGTAPTSAWPSWRHIVLCCMDFPVHCRPLRSIFFFFSLLLPSSPFSSSFSPLPPSSCQTPSSRDNQVLLPLPNDPWKQTGHGWKSLSWYYTYTSLKAKAGEMPWWVRTLAALLEDLVQFPVPTWWLMTAPPAPGCPPLASVGARHTWWTDRHTS